MAGNPLLGILPRPFNSSICTYCLCYSFLPALLCNNEGWEYPDLHQLGSTAGAAVIPSLTEWSAEGFVKHTHTHYHATPSVRSKKICPGYPESLTRDDRPKLSVCAARVSCAPAPAMTENKHRQGRAG